MDTQLFDNIKQKEQPLAEQVAEQISHLIMERQISKDEKLPNEFELAQQLHVGRGTIREAVKLLVARNILEIRRGKGTFVAKHTGVVEDPFGFAYLNNDVKLANDLLEMRLLIEPWAARTAAERATETDLQKLREAFDAVNAKLINKEDHLSADEKFHVALARCTQSSVVPKLIPVITYSVYQLGPINTASSDYDQNMRMKTIQTHQKILSAIFDKDPDRAEKAMIEHLEDNRAAINLWEKNLKEQTR